MEVSVNHVAKTKERSCLGRCKHFFWLGVTFDTVGAATLFTGVFSRLPYYDMFLYLGASMIFLSLLWWTFWYSGNIELSSEESLNSPYRLPSASTLEVLSQTINNRFTLTIGSVSNSFMRMRRRRRRRRQRFLEGQTSLDMTVTGQVENQLDQDKDREEGAAEKGEAQDFGSKDLPKPEAIKSFKEACSQTPDAGDLGREASLPKFVKGPSTSLVQPFTPSPLDQPPTPVILTSKSLPVVSLASVSQTAPILTSKSQPVVALASTSQPLATTLGHPLVPRVSQSYPLVLPASQSQLPVPMASEGHPLNLLEVCQTGPPPLQASQSPSLATISLLQVLPTESLQTQSVDLQVAQPILELQTTYHTQQASQSTSLVQEIRPSQPPSAQEFHTEPVALESPPPADQELSQDRPDAAALPPQSPAPATQAQQSELSGLVPTLAQERKSRSI
ncbi:hypothetical protein FD755_004120 [Muntiacus reevesi]|uniref:Transmembrane protein 238 n=1 Tax=Muntiacus reevesi TaxID=9886 RepID=A0A5J5MUE6_MUNRE|nr:hypothetical protein FD755_004120 [Muntiacus reevesi]